MCCSFMETIHLSAALIINTGQYSKWLLNGLS